MNIINLIKKLKEDKNYGNEYIKMMYKIKEIFLP